MISFLLYPFHLFFFCIVLRILQVSASLLLLSSNSGFFYKDSLSWQAAADAKYYGNTEVYNILKARGAKAPVSEK